jgi:hypothetical protein
MLGNGIIPKKPIFIQLILMPSTVFLFRILLPKIPLPIPDFYLRCSHWSRFGALRPPRLGASISTRRQRFIPSSAQNEEFCLTSAGRRLCAWASQPSKTAASKKHFFWGFAKGMYYK